MKIGIVGCGTNSDYHINFAKTYPGIEILGLVDKDQVRAEQSAEKYGINYVYSNMGELVDKQRPHALHIVTPPQTHYSLAKEAIQCKCHVLVEKPMALNAEDAEELYALAQEHGVKLCTMHNHFFDPCMVRARVLIQEGQVGEIVNVESYYGLNTRIDAFHKYSAPNVLPWIYSLPGGVFHDFLPHPLYVMLPYTGTPQEIRVMEKSFGELPQNISDELRILIKGEKAFGVLTLSFVAKPHLHFLRIYGTEMTINVNFDTMTTTCHPVSRLPKAAQKATYNLTESGQLFTSTVSNIWNFGWGRLRPYQGMKALIHKFYDALDGKGKVPVSKHDALVVIETMDEIWHQVTNTRLNLNPIIPGEPTKHKEVLPKILVTGATGFLGSRLVELLIQRHYSVRALARKLSNINKLKELRAEIFFGDIANLESLKPAFEGVDMVVHAAADTSGNETESHLSTIQGTKNILELCQQFHIKKLIYISSCSVYGIADYNSGQVVTEESPLERFPEKRGYYSSAKLRAENMVSEHINNGKFPIVCLRPGTIYGPGGEVFTPMMGFSLGRKIFAIIGDGDLVLPLVYIDNLVEAIVATIEKDESNGKIYNVLDSDQLTKKVYVEMLLKKLYPNSHSIYVPYHLLYLTVFFLEVIAKLFRSKPLLTRYRLISSQKNISYGATKIKNELQWKPPVTLKNAIENILQENQNEKSL